MVGTEPASCLSLFGPTGQSGLCAAPKFGAAHWYILGPMKKAWGTTAGVREVACRGCTVREVHLLSSSLSVRLTVTVPE